MADLIPKPNTLRPKDGDKIEESTSRPTERPPQSHQRGAKPEAYDWTSRTERPCIRIAKVPREVGIAQKLMALLSHHVGPVRGARALWEVKPDEPEDMVVFITFWWVEDCDFMMSQLAQSGGHFDLEYAYGTKTKQVLATRTSARNECFPGTEYPVGVAQLILVKEMNGRKTYEEKESIRVNTVVNAYYSGLNQ